MTTKRLTALIPAHNDDYILSFCLAAAAPHFDEVLVLDDASTDHTPEVIADACRRWPHVRVLPRSVLGPAGWQLGWIEARNRLMAATDSDWLFFLDSDDVLAEYSAHLLHAIAEASDRAPVVRLQLTELWGDFAHTTGRLRHYDRCHLFVNRSKVGDLRWTGGTAAKLPCLPTDGSRLTAQRSAGPLFFHCKGVKPDRRLVERQFVRRWMRQRGDGWAASSEDLAGLAEMPDEEVHRLAMRMLFCSKGDPCRPYPADGPRLPAVIRQAPRRFQVVYGKVGDVPLVADRLDHMPRWPEGGAR